MKIDSLYQTLLDRRTASPQQSWTAKLMSGGVTSISKKIAEEVTELTLAARDVEALSKENKEDTAKKQHLKDEAADVLYHYLVLLAYFDISPEQILEVLDSRKAKSGLKEKQERSGQ